MKEFKQYLEEAIKREQQACEGTFRAKVQSGRNSFKQPMNVTIGYDEENQGFLQFKIETDAKTFGFTLTKKQAADLVKCIKNPNAVKETLKEGFDAEIYQCQKTKAKKSYEKWVGEFFNDIAKEHPDWENDQVEDAAEEQFNKLVDDGKLKLVDEE